MSLIRCSFCGRSQNDVRRLVAASTSETAICNGCVARAVEVLVSNNDEPADPVFIVTPEGAALVARMSGEMRA